MKIDIHKATAVFAVILLTCAVLWWIKWKREELPPIHRRFKDSVTYHVNEAEKHAEIGREYMDEFEAYADNYFDAAIDSSDRAKLGAEIWANAVRKADSLRKRSP